MRVLFWGTPDFALPPLRALLGEGFDVVGVVTQPDTRRRTIALDARAAAGQARRGRPSRSRCSSPSARAATSSSRSCATLAPDISVVVAYGHILSQPSHRPAARSARSTSTRRCCRSLRGAAPIQAAIRDGHAETGVTIMRMVKALDAGPSIAPGAHARRRRRDLRRAAIAARRARRAGADRSARAHRVGPRRRRRRRTSRRRPTRRRSIAPWRASTGPRTRRPCRGSFARTIRAPAPTRCDRLARPAEVKLFGARVAPRTSDSAARRGPRHRRPTGMTVACGARRRSVQIASVQPAGKRRIVAARVGARPGHRGRRATILVGMPGADQDRSPAGVVGGGVRCSRGRRRGECNGGAQRASQPAAPSVTDARRRRGRRSARTFAPVTCSTRVRPPHDAARRARSALGARARVRHAAPARAASTRTSTRASAAASCGSTPICSTCSDSARRSSCTWRACRRTRRSRRPSSWRSGATAWARASSRTRCFGASIASAKRSRFPRRPDPVDALALAGSHPRWLVARWVERFGADETRRLLEANNREAPLIARPYHVVREQLEAMLETAGIHVDDAPLVRDSIVLSSPVSSLTELGAFRQGLFHMQDPASTLVDAVRVRADRARSSPTFAPRRAESRSSCRARRRSVFASDSSFARLQRVRRQRASARDRHACTRTSPTRGIPAITAGRSRARRRAVHRHGHVPPAPRRALASQDLGHRGDGVAAALDSARGGRRSCARAACSCTARARSSPRRTTSRSIAFSSIRMALDPPPEGVVPHGARRGRLRVLPQRHGTDGAFAARLRRPRDVATVRARCRTRSRSSADFSSRT